MEINPKLERRLKKLLALAERGVGGEKENAQRMLDKLLELEGLTLDDICEDVKTDVWFRYKPGPHNKQLLIQTLRSVIGSKRVIWTSKYKQRQIGCECTEYERLQIEMAHTQDDNRIEALELERRTVFIKKL